MNTEPPSVFITTPVYNGEAFLRPCIESVLAQTYQNWRYLIVDNCSKDRTGEIAEEYAARDSRISVLRATEFVALIDNHNRALSYLPEDCRYCKPLMADDWLFPECLEKMVRHAESFPSIGLVCCYAFDGVNVLWDGLSYSTGLLDGREVGRQKLLGGPYIFGSPSSMLIRADLVRKRQPFYNRVNLNADVESCYDLLREADFGFVHQVLVFNRVHERSASSHAKRLDGLLIGSIFPLFRYGEEFLAPDVLQHRRRQRLDEYYRMLARGALRLEGVKFWRFHREKLALLGLSLNPARVAWAVLVDILNRLTCPRQIFTALADLWAARRRAQ